MSLYLFFFLHCIHMVCEVIEVYCGCRLILELDTLHADLKVLAFRSPLIRLFVLHNLIYTVFLFGLIFLH